MTGAAPHAPARSTVDSSTRRAWPLNATVGMTKGSGATRALLWFARLLFHAAVYSLVEEATGTCMEGGGVKGGAGARGGAPPRCPPLSHGEISFYSGCVHASGFHLMD